jgi:hypothetical protein
MAVQHQHQLQHRTCFSIICLRSWSSSCYPQSV